MPSPFIGVRIPQEVYEALQLHIEETGEKLPRLVINALKAYLNIENSSDDSLSPKISRLEQRLTAVEEQLSQAQKGTKELTHADVARRTGYAPSTISTYHKQDKGFLDLDDGCKYVPKIRGDKRFWIALSPTDIN